MTIDCTNFKVVIPARFSSTRFPGKPLIDLCGKPLIQHVFERAVESGAAEVIVATDDERIRLAAHNFGAEVCMTSEVHPSGTDRIAEVALQLGWNDQDIVVNLQGDEPLTPPQIINQVARNLGQHSNAGIATLCTGIRSVEEVFDPHVVKVVRDARGFALYFSRAPIPWHRDEHKDLTAQHLRQYQRHLGIYAYRVNFLAQYTRMHPCPLELAEKLEQLRALWNGVHIHVDEAEALPGHGVDTPQDLQQVEEILISGSLPW